MSEIQVASLFLCAIVGVFGVPMLTGAKTDFAAKAALCWILFWWLPPLATIWVKGVFG